MYDVAIVGGGVIGCAVARFLSQYEVSGVLLEKYEEVGFGTSKSNSGIIHAGHHSSPDTLKGRLAVPGNRMFDRLSEELKFAFKRIGELVVAAGEEEIAVLRKLKLQGEQKGVPGMEMWDRERLRREEPNLSKRLIAALHVPTAGVINPYEFCFALVENAVDNGFELKINAEVTGIRYEKDSFLIETNEETVKSRFVINSAGLWADKVAGMAGIDEFTIHPRKGEEYMLDKRLQGLVKRLIFPVPRKNSKGTLIIPTYDGTMMVGPTAEDVDDRNDLTTTRPGAEKVFQSVKKLCPSIDKRDTIAEFAGLRAVSNTNDFIIGPSSRKGFINAAGIQSPGLTAAPAIAEYILEILQQQGLKLIKKKDFNPSVKGPARFALQNPKRRRELIRENPGFARVVCRCELVTEAEIHEAVDHGARTLDGIKFRTRAGMGRCNGGFCTYRCMKILSERLNKPLHEITKRGDDSQVIYPRAEYTNDPASEPPAGYE